jgi:hypothetical protein
MAGRIGSFSLSHHARSLPCALMDIQRDLRHYTRARNDWLAAKAAGGNPPVPKGRVPRFAKRRLRPSL